MNSPSPAGPEALQIFLANQPRFLDFLRRHVTDAAEAEDLLQHALLKAIRHESDWDSKENILAWFYRILRNVLTDQYRSRASERHKLEATQAEAGSAMSGVTLNNLSVRLHRARQSLRTNLEKTCGVCTRHGCLDCTCGEALADRV